MRKDMRRLAAVLLAAAILPVGAAMAEDNGNNMRNTWEIQYDSMHPCIFGDRHISNDTVHVYQKMGQRSFPKLKIPHQSHADFCSTDTAGGLDNKKRRYAPRGGVAYRLFLWGFPKGATPPFGTRLCEAKCSVLYALSALP